MITGTGGRLLCMGNLLYNLPRKMGSVLLLIQSLVEADGSRCHDHHGKSYQRQDLI